MELVGTICGGRISKITAYGAFVALENGKSGMIHISEVSQSFVRDIREHLSEGQAVRVKIIKIDDAGRLSLSLRQVPADKAVKAPPVQYSTPESSGDFEDMMSRFKAFSDDKLSDQKRRQKRRE